MVKAWGLLALRIILAIVLINAGYGKLGAMHEAITGLMAAKLHLGGLSSAVTYLVGLLEVVGGLMILLGVYASVAAAWVCIIMVVAILGVHLGGPLNGYFLPLLVFGGSFALIGTGAGKFRVLKSQCCCKECKNGGGLNGGCCSGGACKCGPEKKDMNAPTNNAPMMK